MPDAQTVYFSFPRYPPDVEFRERTAALAQLLDESLARDPHLERLAIDTPVQVRHPQRLLLGTRPPKGDGADRDQDHASGGQTPTGSPDARNR